MIFCNEQAPALPLAVVAAPGRQLLGVADPDSQLVV